MSNTSRIRAPAGRNTGVRATARDGSELRSVRRKERIEILCFPDEKQSITRRAGTVPVSRWGRNRLLGRRTIDADVVPPDRVIGFAETIERLALEGEPLHVFKAAGALLQQLRPKVAQTEHDRSEPRPTRREARIEILCFPEEKASTRRRAGSHPVGCWGRNTLLAGRSGDADGVPLGRVIDFAETIERLSREADMPGTIQTARAFQRRLRSTPP